MTGNSLGTLSCDLFRENAGPAGVLLPVDSSMHFKQDLEYHQWNGSWTFGKDGTFEFEQFNSPTPTESLQTGGMRGTYTYDPAEFDLGLAAKGVYNGPVPNAWSTLTATQSHTVLANLWFTGPRFADVFKKNGSGSERIWKEAGGDSSQPEPNTWS